MSTMMIKVCEECGKQETSRHSWLIMENIDIKSVETNESVIKESNVDLCSQGCLLRYIAKAVDAATTGHTHVQHEEEDETPRQVRAFI